MRRSPERDAAIAAGERFYFTGKPCKRGHVSKRTIVGNRCAQCASEDTLRCAAKRPEHPARVVARVAKQARYSTGEPCRNGHTADRWTNSGQCVVCREAFDLRWHAKRPGLRAKWARDQRARDPTPHRQANKRWKENNTEKAAAIMARWIANNPERRRLHGRAATATRRTRIANNGGSFTADDILALMEKQRYRCANCNKTVRKFEIDHIMPVALGGSSYPSNLQLLCRPCNRAKWKKDPLVWARQNGRLL